MGDIKYHYAQFKDDILKKLKIDKSYTHKKIYDDILLKGKKPSDHAVGRETVHALVIQIYVDGFLEKVKGGKFKISNEGIAFRFDNNYVDKKFSNDIKEGQRIIGVENNIWSTKVSKSLYWFRWWPLLISALALIWAVYAYFNPRDTNKNSIETEPPELNI